MVFLEANDVTLPEDHQDLKPGGIKICIHCTSVSPTNFSKDGQLDWTRNGKQNATSSLVHTSY